MTSKSNENDIVIVSALRTPISKAKRGNLSGLTNDMLVYHAIKGTLEKTKLDPALIDEVCLGHGLSPMNGSVAVRVGALRAGLPLNIPMSTVNRQCASGLDSIEALANKIKLNKIEIGLAGGFESMTSYGIDQGKLTCLENDAIKVKDCFIQMGETAEILAEKHSISREKSDIFAFDSIQKAYQATQKRLFEDEIVPIMVNDQIVDFDDGIRLPEKEKFANLKSVFRENGVCSAGNSSQLSDGASAILIMKRKKAEELGLEIMGVYLDYVVLGVNPSVMGEGPVPAVRKLLEKNKLNINDIDYFEINEAFACQAVYCIEELGIDSSKVNLHGGSIPIGHPIGCTGGRLVGSLLNVMNKNKMKGYGIVSLCVGTGQGVAALFKKE